MAKPGPLNVDILRFLVIGGQTPPLSPLEVLHLVDVRQLFFFLEALSAAWLVRNRYKPRKSLSVIISVATLVLIGLALFRFEDAWAAAHRLVFSNEFWLLPNSSYLIQHFYHTFMPSVIMGLVTWISFWLIPIFRNERALQE
ncbi:DUF1461 domain-containing protein [Coprothermobacteraceae bacterium]|nr:DUF1461 domain-containing protein [Coprothermobacteraceae bacterium]